MTLWDELGGRTWKEREARQPAGQRPSRRRRSTRRQLVQRPPAAKSPR